jgi:hypothetical protein
MADQDIISRLLASRVGTAVSPDVIAATQQGLGRTDLSALLSPQLLVGTGAVDTAALGAGLQQYYNRLIEEDLARFEEDTRAAQVAAGKAPVKPLPPQPSAVSANIANKWQNWVDDNMPGLAPVMVQLLTQAGQGAAGGEAVIGVLAGLEKPVADVLGPVVEELQSDLDQVQKQGIEFATRQRIYQEDLADYEVEKQDYDARVRAGEEGVAPLTQPDMAAAWAQYAEDIGVPGLGSLPSPLETYQFTPEDVRAVRKPTQRGTTMNLLESMLQRRGQARPKAQPMGLPPAGELPEVLESGQGPRSAITASEGKRRAMAATRAAMERRAAQDPLDRVAEGFRMMERSKARSLARQAAAQGRTPLQDALNEMIRYGVLEASQ